MRTTWGAAVLALGVGVGLMGTTTQGAGAQAKPTVEAHQTLMKTVASTNQAMNAKIKMSDLPGAAKDAQTVVSTFGDIEKWWTAYNKTDAVMWAQQGKAAATDMAAALSAGDATKAQAAQKTMQGSCGSCHMAYREGSAQTGGYKFKEGVITP